MYWQCNVLSWCACRKTSKLCISKTNWNKNAVFIVWNFYFLKCFEEQLKHKRFGFKRNIFIYINSFWYAYENDTGISLTLILLDRLEAYNTWTRARTFFLEKSHSSDQYKKTIRQANSTCYLFKYYTRFTMSFR